MTSGRARLRDEQGMATVLGACVIAAMVALIVGVSWFGAAVVARHRAQSAVDLAALAAAQRWILALDDPCGAARSVAAETRVRITLCRTDGDDVVVTGSVDIDLGPFGARTAVADARAGPSG
ncbi:Rv3654c family TadE-like protein [Williamsia sp. MIQD14]|uniref:Rv3654c family TadE-like protein n=1 Tax=Williamsia sp. MIQD14 TaxID=3425703 RepID=UPI003D9FF622